MKRILIRARDTAYKHRAPIFDEIAGQILRVPFAGPIIRRTYLTVRLWPRIVPDKIGLMNDGVRLLKAAKRQITVASTLASEDLPIFLNESPEENEARRKYYEELFSTVHRNRLNLRRPRPLVIRRFMDLTDMHKCEEAMALLYYGSDIEIHHSTVPLEFLNMDDELLLLGFPAGEQLLSGIRLYDRKMCEAVSRWLVEHERGAQKNLRGNKKPERSAIDDTQQPQSSLQFTRPSELAAFVREHDLVQTHYRKQRKFKDYENSLLINAAELLGDEAPSQICARAFDSFSRWYPHLYDQEASYGRYEALAHFIYRKIDSSSPTFLDCGCAHGEGAKVLHDHGIQYWGVDVSEELIKEAEVKQHPARFVACDAMTALLNQRGRDLPKKFDVIACQGNTFDYFLGPAQKWFVLSLFKKNLNKGGLLFFTGAVFDKRKPQDTRQVPSRFDGPPREVLFDFKWSGDYAQIDVKFEGKSQGSVVVHPTDRGFLERELQKLGFKYLKKNDHKLFDWYGPRGSNPYYVYVFQNE
jgi:hypothetical protein